MCGVFEGAAAADRGHGRDTGAPTRWRRAARALAAYFHNLSWLEGRDYAGGRAGCAHQRQGRPAAALPEYRCALCRRPPTSGGRSPRAVPPIPSAAWWSRRGSGSARAWWRERAPRQTRATWARADPERSGWRPRAGASCGSVGGEQGLAPMIRATRACIGVARGGGPREESADHEGAAGLGHDQTAAGFPALNARRERAGGGGGGRATGRRSPAPSSAASVRRTAAAETATPIEHLVVLMQEHHTFDNYFGTGQTASRRTCGCLSIRTIRRAAISWSRSF